MFSKKRLLFGAIALYLLGTAFHFLFELFGRPVWAALFFAVNESVWEHMKLLNTAAIVWMTADWLLAEKALRPGFFAARAVALPVALLSIPILFYFIKGAFNAENLIIDIALYVFSSVLYQYMALKLERRFAAKTGSNLFGIVALAAIFGIFVLFTFLPPHLPLFQDTPTGTYGIPK